MVGPTGSHPVRPISGNIMHRSTILSFAAVLAVALSVLACLAILFMGIGSWKLQLSNVSTPEMPASLLLCLGLAAGLAVGCSAAWLTRSEGEQGGMALASAACAILAAAIAARLDGIPFLQAFVTTLLGLGGFVSLSHAIRSIAWGDAFGAEGRWGGLGNGLDGWRLTPATSSTLLASLLFCASVACATLLPFGGTAPPVNATGGPAAAAMSPRTGP